MGVSRGGVSRGGIPRNLINHYFGYHIRDQRGRFTPGGSLLKEFFFFWNFDFLNVFLNFDYFLALKLGLTLSKHCQNIAKTLPRHCQDIAKTLAKHMQNMPKSCLKHVQNMSETWPTYVWNTFNSCLKHVQNMSETFPKHIWNMTKSRLKHVQNRSKTWSKRRLKSQSKSRLSIALPRVSPGYPQEFLGIPWVGTHPPLGIGLFFCTAPYVLAMFWQSLDKV